MLILFNYINSHFALLMVLISTAASQTTRFCGSDSSCKPIFDCPEILKLARSPDFNDRLKFRDSVCDTQSVLKVCCPSPTPSPTTDRVPPIFFPDSGHVSPRPTGGNLLPERCGNPSTEDRVHGGRPAPIGAYPWVVAMGYTEVGVPGVRFDCAGSLINSRYVLTAAHCLHPSALGTRKLELLHIGDWDLSKPVDCQAKTGGTKCYPTHVVAKPEDIILHPSYSKRVQDSDDIALIRLDREIDFTDLSKAPITPICLPPENRSAKLLAQGRPPLAAGWGFTEHGNRSDILLRVQIPFANDQLCKDSFGTKFVSNQLCVGGVDGKDTCSGDSGGPLVIPGPRGPPFLQIGIVSYGSLPCAISKIPAVYTDVAKYVSWIKQTLRP